MKNISSKEFLNSINGKKYVLVDFFAPWCGPCRMIAPVLEEASEKFLNVSFCKINIDDNQKVADEYKVTSIPTIILFKNGKEIARFSGYKQDPQEVFDFIETNINDNTKK